MKEFVISGDSEQYEDCLVYVIKGGSREQAEDVLQRMLTEPTDTDKIVMEGLTNFRIKEVEDGWWNHGCD